MILNMVIQVTAKSPKILLVLLALTGTVKIKMWKSECRKRFSVRYHSRLYLWKDIVHSSSIKSTCVDLI